MTGKIVHTYALLQRRTKITRQLRRMIALKCCRLPEIWLLLLALFSILAGCWIGSSVTRLYKGRKLTSFSAPQSLPKIYASTNPHGAERLPPEIIKPHSDFFLRGCVGYETLRKPSYLLTLAVGFQQKDIVDKIVNKFSENFTILLFHYDGRASEWDQFEWSHRAIHISAQKQTKWWYVKRFLHPDIVAQYEYIFIWDEDIGVENFDGEEYIKLVKKYGLEVSQPAITSTKGMTYNMTQKRNTVEVHRHAEEKGCDPLLPPCAGFVEIMAPVFSRNAWNCVWNLIQNDLVHGWGLDYAFWRCVEKPHEKIGVVDAQWVDHMVLPTLRNEGESINGKHSRIWVRARSYGEWKEFEKRMKTALNQNSANEHLVAEKNV